MYDNISQSLKNANRIIACEDWQVRYWRTVLGCSTSELRTAIKNVGNSVEAVKNYFNNNLRQTA